VTTYLIDKIAAAKNVDCFNVLTGFKYIGEMMTKLEGDRYFLAGGEESYGYLVGEHARDKDAVIACAMIAEMVAYHKDNGSSLYEALMDVYEEYGFYLERLVSLKKEGKAGAEEIQAMLKSLRGNTPATLGGSKVTMVKDYLSSESKEMATSEITKIDLPSANVLQFFLEDGSIISARPSGTEPKVKFYCSVNTELADKADYDKVKVILDNRLDAILKDLGV
jgi:phosphoglucomutase